MKASIVPWVLSATIAATGTYAIAESVTTTDDNAGVAISPSFDYLSGKYGTQQKSTQSVGALSLEYMPDRYSLGLYLPYIHQTAPAGTLAGRRVRSNRRNAPATPVTTESGVGDVEASVGIALLDSDNEDWAWDAKGTVKFATADRTKGLGTGENDYSLETSVSRFIDNFTATVNIGYSVLGSPGKVTVQGIAQNIKFNNVAFGGIDGSFKINSSTQIGASLNLQQAAAKTSTAARDISLYMSLAMTDSSSLRFYVLKGFADGSPSRGAGVSALFDF